MAITLNTIKCPECGASLSFEEGREKMFCSYCGTQILLTNENEHIYRHIDEAGVKKAETERMIELKKMEMAEKERQSKERSKMLKIRISIALGIVMVASFALGAVQIMFVALGMVCAAALVYIWLRTLSGDEDDNNYDGKIKLPSSVLEYNTKSFSAIETILRSAGFTNISCVPLGDLRTGIIHKPDMVESITINGRTVTSRGKRFSPDVNVVISYHSFAQH